jgi:glycosyltransferase involved in cell wall biosynthesis
MLASLRDYKGVPELMRLAGRFSARADLTFHLVLNDDETAVRRYFSATAAPANVAVHPRTSDTAAHYARASLVLNLSRPDLWIETFGLTILEAMAFGVPVIAPPVGGPLELISDGFDGFLIDSRDGNAVAEKVQSLADDEGLCQRLSVAARLRSARFSREAFAASIGKVLDQYAPNN